MVLAALAMTQALYSEPLRPQFHFTSEKGWLNDPNGLVYYEGEYHLFFQHNPFGTEWGHMTWGHAVSPDLVRWKQLPNAIEPDARGTIYSGSAVTDPKNTSGLNADIIALYTAAGGKNEESKGQPFTQCLAYSRDKGRTFAKLPNPVIGNVLAENRDPKVTWSEERKRWIMALYLDQEEFAIYTSDNLQNWTPTQRLVFPGAAECPDFFEMPIEGSRDRRWVFTGANGLYWVGTFDGRRFHPEGSPRQVEFGGNNYAVQTYYGLPNDRRVQIGWMRGGSFPGMPFNQQMTFPCDLTLRRTKDGLRVYRYPVNEIEKLWGDKKALDVHEKMPASESCDIEVEFEAGQDATTLRVNEADIKYDPITRVLTVFGRSAYLEPEDGKIKLRVLADRTSIEVFGNDGRVSLSVSRNRAATFQVAIATASRKSVRGWVREIKSAW